MEREIGRRERTAMRNAIDVSRACQSELGKVAPKVGAVLIRGGRMLATAYRGELATGEHAEFTLLERKLSDQSLAGATLYTTLEPCTQRRHPKIACADRIVERRIKRVFIGMLDPNPRIRGLGERRLREAGIEIGRFDMDMQPEIEELNREFIREHPMSIPRKRTSGRASGPSGEAEVGPNGHRVGYTRNGDKVEWIPEEAHPGTEWPLLLRRNDKAILKAYNELWDKVWWNRHQVQVQKMRNNSRTLTKEQRQIMAQARLAARRIEKKYGKKNFRVE